MRTPVGADRAAPPAARKSAVIGAGGCGSAIAHRLAACGLFDAVLLADVRQGRAQGRALDIDQAACIEGFRARTTGVTLRGKDDYRAIAGSQVVVIAPGLSRRPGMRRADLLEANAEAVAAAAMGVRRFAPEAVVIVITNPLDEMTALAQEVSGQRPEQVIGQAGVLDSARFRYAVAQELGVPVAAVQAVVLGPHSEESVPLVSACRVDGRPLAGLLPADRIKAVVEHARHGGAHIVGLLRTGSTSVAPSAAALRMIQAIVTDSNAELPVCTRLRGEYGIDGVCLGVVATLGVSGVTSVVEHAMAPEELRALRAAAELVRPHQLALRETATARVAG